MPTSLGQDRVVNLLGRCRDDIYNTSEFMSNITTIAEHAQDVGENGKIEELSKYARSVVATTKRIKLAKDRLDRLTAENVSQVIEEFKASKRFAEAEGQQEMLKDEDLKAFAQRFSDVKGVVDGFDIDEDDVVATESLGALNDPFTQAALAEQNGEWPRKLPCKHTYNFDTLMQKKNNGGWVLETCSVAGCSKPIPNDRRNLPVDSERKRQIKQVKRQRTRQIDDAEEV